jgi:hypothetical protein
MTGDVARLVVPKTLPKLGSHCSILAQPNVCAFSSARLTELFLGKGFKLFPIIAAEEIAFSGIQSASSARLGYFRLDARHLSRHRSS